MDEHITRTSLVRLVEAHKRSVLRILELKESSEREEVGALDAIVARASETATRQRLLEWEAPTTALAIEKLVHLLAHVLAGQLEFDDRSLDLIRREVARIANPPAKVSTGRTHDE